MDNMFVEIKISSELGNGELAKKLNKIEGIYENIQFIKSNVNEHLFLAKKKYNPKTHKEFYENEKNNCLIL